MRMRAPAINQSRGPEGHRHHPSVSLGLCTCVTILDSLHLCDYTDVTFPASRCLWLYVDLEGTGENNLLTDDEQTGASPPEKRTAEDREGPPLGELNPR